MPVGEKVAEDILCLPIYPDFKFDAINLVIKIPKDKT
jgi:hypothetical protein